MTLPDYCLCYPETDETNILYSRRLEVDGYDEIRIRMALRIHFAMGLSEFGEFFEDFKDARLRHLAIIHDIAPNRSDYSFALKVSKDLGISQERAEHWVMLYKAQNWQRNSRLTPAQVQRMPVLRP